MRGVRNIFICFRFDWVICVLLVMVVVVVSVEWICFELYICLADISVSVWFG